jgi:programmed cell death 6-interacting protein
MFSCKDFELLQSGFALLESESKKDSDQILLHGPKWQRTSSQQLTSKLIEKGNEYREKMDQAHKSNQLVKQKMEQYIHLVQNLELDKRELEQSIPASNPNTTLALKDPNVKQLKLQLNQLNEILKKRNEVTSTLKKKSEQDDIGIKHLNKVPELP